MTPSIAPDALPPFARDERVIPTYLFHLIQRILTELELDLTPLTHGTSLTLNDLSSDEARISFDESLQLIDNALNISQRDDLGLLVGSRESLNDWGMMGYAIANSETSEEVLDIAQRYYQITTNLTRFSIVHNDGRLKISAQANHPVEKHLNRFLIEEHLGCNVKMTRDMIGETFAPMEAHFSYPAPEYLEAYEALFHCPLHFDADENFILISEDVLNRNNHRSNPVTAKMALKLCEEMLQQQQSQRSLISQIKLMLINADEGFPALSQVANQMHMSERNLRRHLADHGTSFRAILDDVRQQLALEYLADPAMAMEDIAARLDFSDSSSFYRAFKKWMGKPPSHFRPHMPGKRDQ